MPTRDEIMAIAVQGATPEGFVRLLALAPKCGERQEDGSIFNPTGDEGLGFLESCIDMARFIVMKLNAEAAAKDTFEIKTDTPRDPNERGN